MSTHFPSVKPKQIIKILKSKNFEEKRITGSHHIFKNSQTGRIIPVPVHGNKDLKKGTLRSILKMANLTVEELNQLLKE